MSRDDGFAVMDVSTDYVNDPKWRKLYRAHPELLPVAFLAYTATMCESWKAGKRVSIDEAWPIVLPFDGAVVAALREASFLDRRGLIIPHSWDGWFGPANRRREAARAAGREGNATRWGKRSGGDRVAIAEGSGGDPRTVPYRSVPSGPTVPPDRNGSYTVDEQPKSGTFPPIGAVRPGR